VHDAASGFSRVDTERALFASNLVSVRGPAVDFSAGTRGLAIRAPLSQDLPTMAMRTRSLTMAVSWVTFLACSTTTKVPSASDTSDSGTCISGAVATACPTPAPTFSGDVLPLMNARCGNCHSHDNDAGLWPLDDWQTISDWQSTILDVLRSCNQPPPTVQPLMRSEREAIEGWIMCGAQNN